MQIPAFLCRQTDLLLAAAATDRPVNVKKGQFMSAQDMRYAVDKVCSGRSSRTSGGMTDRPMESVLLTERGTFFGYRDLVVDFRNLVVMRKFAPVIFDGTHAVQRPGAQAGTSGGDRPSVGPLTRAAVAVGVDGLFLEVHPRPDEARSDGATSLSFEALESVLIEVKALAKVVVDLRV